MNKVARFTPNGKTVLSHKEAAEFLGITPGYLYVLRFKKRGPAAIPEKMLDLSGLTGPRQCKLFYHKNTLAEWRKHHAPVPRRRQKIAA